jgi:NitT/TauT family transport system substrate-binding protein
MGRRIAALALGLAAALTGVAQAEVADVRLSKQFGLGYLSMIVIESQKLIEKHTRASGLGEVKTVWMQHSGPAVQIDAMLAGQVDLIGPGVPTLATIWDRTVDRRSVLSPRFSRCRTYSSRAIRTSRPSPTLPIATRSPCPPSS